MARVFIGAVFFVLVLTLGSAAVDSGFQDAGQQYAIEDESVTDASAGVIALNQSGRPDVFYDGRVTVTQPGYALDYEGVNSGDYTEIPDDASLDIRENITIAFTARVGELDVNTNNNYRGVINKGPAVTDAYGVIFEEDGLIDWTVKKGGTRVNVRGGHVPLNRSTVTVVVTHDNSTDSMAIWLNGAKVADSTVTAGKIDATTSALYLSDPGSDRHVNATLDAVRIDARVWSDAEIRDYENGTAVDASARRLELNMNEGTGRTTADASGNSNNGTVTGAEWVAGLTTPYADGEVAMVTGKDYIWHDENGTLEVTDGGRLDGTRLAHVDYSFQKPNDQQREIATYVGSQLEVGSALVYAFGAIIAVVVLRLLVGVA